MPVSIKKVKGGYQVVTPNMVHAKKTTLKKAEAQKRIIEDADAKKAGKK